MIVNTVMMEEDHQHRDVVGEQLQLVGTLETMPAKMISETPLPTPCSVINWPSHTPSIVPAVMPMISVSVGSRSPPVKPQLGSTLAPPTALRCQQRALGDCLEHGQRNRQPERVLIEPAASLLAFLAQRLKRRDDRNQQLQDNGRRDVRIDAQGHDAHARQATAAEEVQQVEQDVVVLREQRSQRFLVNAR
jgi:hypothetical protein